jgi:adenosine deaminase
MYEEYSKHPVTDLIDLEFNVSINTDNRLMSNTSIDKEIDIAKNLGINNVENILEKSARYSFLNNL